MNLWADTSLWVSVYLRGRPAGPDAERLLGSVARVGVVSVTQVELTAVLSRLAGGGEIDARGAAAAIAAFEAQLPGLWVIPVSDHVVASAVSLARKHTLKGYDAIQLAGACEWRRLLAGPVTVATLDDLLWRAAGAEGFDVWPSDPPVCKPK